MVKNYNGSFNLSALRDEIEDYGVPASDLSVIQTDTGVQLVFPDGYESGVDSVVSAHDAQTISSAERMQQISDAMRVAKSSVRETDYARTQYIEAVRIAVRNAMKTLTTHIATGDNEPTSAQLNAVYDDLLDVVNDPTVASSIRDYFVNLFQAEYYIKHGTLSDDLSNILGGGLLGTTDEQKRRMIDAIKEMVSKKSTEMGLAN